MRSGYFITGTDTDVGKTWATLALMHFFQQHGRTVLGMKPVAAGALWQEGQLKNADALLLQAHSSLPVAYSLINPYVYEQAISPHLAGVNNPVEVQKIVACYQQLKVQAECIVVEGAGGWLSPINQHQAIADVAQALGLPVIIVVAIRLGCINQALLTYRAVKSSGLECVGWIAQCNDVTMLAMQENIQSIQVRVDAPLLGCLPFQAVADFAELARKFETRYLIST
ncbi:MAG: dethiobiotin synthase [Methylovulum sp.]|jgi:dethiobiotin synthetase|nr:dethiobiotin synthase [Methylovulum sp.]